MPQTLSVLLHSGVAAVEAAASSANRTLSATSAAAGLTPAAWSNIKSVLVAVGASSAAILWVCRKSKEGGTAQSKTIGAAASASSSSESDESDGEAVSNHSPSVTVPPQPGDQSQASSSASASSSGESLNKKDCVVVVDPVSTGANLADLFLRRGCLVVSVTSGRLTVDHNVPSSPEIRSSATHNPTHTSEKGKRGGT